MIRINLEPNDNAKRRAQPTRAVTAVQSIVPTTDVSKGGIIAVAMLLGWVGLGVVGYFVNGSVKQDGAKLKTKAGGIAKQAANINSEIDEEGLQARANRYEELKAAEELLEKKKRTPVYVFFELANILTTDKGPDVDEAEQRQRELLDPQARLDPNWDANSVWLTEIKNTDNSALAIEGGTRDPDDLSEFVKRLRASARFSTISHPEYELEEVDEVQVAKRDKPVDPGESTTDYYVFQLTAKVRYWD